MAQKKRQRTTKYAGKERSNELEVTGYDAMMDTITVLNFILQLLAYLYST